MQQTVTASVLYFKENQTFQAMPLSFQNPNEIIARSQLAMSAYSARRTMLSEHNAGVGDVFRNNFVDGKASSVDQWAWMLRDLCVYTNLKRYND